MPNFLETNRQSLPPNFIHSFASNDRASTSNAAPTSKQRHITPKQLIYISRKALAEWIEGWECTMSGCQPENAKVSEATFYLLKCGHRVCETCRDRKITNMGESKWSLFKCCECKMSHKLKEMKELNEASYINSYRDQLKQKGIPCTTCKERHQEVRYYPRELMYVCLSEKCSDVMDKNVEYNIYSNTNHVSLATDGEGTESDIKLTRVCLYCKSDGEHSKHYVVKAITDAEKDCKDNGGDCNRKHSPNEYEPIINECTLELINDVEGLKATMEANFDKKLHDLERNPWHLAMLNRSFMIKLSKEMLTCDSCKFSFSQKSENDLSLHHGSIHRCHQRVLCHSCKYRGERCPNEQCLSFKYFTNDNNTVEFPHLYELDHFSKMNFWRTYHECYYCNRVHSVEYLRFYTCIGNQPLRCCLDCMLRDGRLYDDIREHVFKLKLNDKISGVSTDFYNVSDIE